VTPRQISRLTGYRLTIPGAAVISETECTASTEAYCGLAPPLGLRPPAAQPYR
jgi:hypothetical protein